MDRMRRRPSPALVIALVALFVALGGTGYAAFAIPKNSVGSPQVVNGSLQAVDLAEKTRTALRGNQGARGPAGPAGATGATGGALPPLTWSNLTLFSGWAKSSTSGYGPPGLQYAKDAQGFVHLRGTLSGYSATNELVATLPSGFRPPHGAWVPLGESCGCGYVSSPVHAWIDSSGNIRAQNGVGSNQFFVSFEGVEFFAG